MRLQGNVSPRARNASLRRLLSQSTKLLLCAACQGHARAWHRKKSAAIGKKLAGQRNLLPPLYRHPALPIPAQWHRVHRNAKKKKKGRGNRAEDPLLRLSIQNSMTAISGLLSKKHLHGLHTAAAAFRLSVQMIQGQGT